MGVRSLSPPGSRGPTQSLECPALCCDLGKWFVGITHGFIHFFLGTVRRQQFWEDWARQPWGKVTVPGCRGSCGAVLVIRHPGESAGEAFLETPTLVLQLHVVFPGNPILPEPLDLAVLHTQHTAQQLHHIILKLVIVQPAEDTRKEQEQGFGEQSAEKMTLP